MWVAVFVGYDNGYHATGWRIGCASDGWGGVVGVVRCIYGNGRCSGVHGTWVSGFSAVTCYVAHCGFGGVVAICQWGYGIYAVGAIWVHGGAHGLNVTCRIGDHNGYNLSRFRIGGTGDGWGVVVGQVWCHNGDGHFAVDAALSVRGCGVTGFVGHADAHAVTAICYGCRYVYAVAAIRIHGGADGLGVAVFVGYDDGHDLSCLNIVGLSADGWGGVGAAWYGYADGSGGVHGTWVSGFSCVTCYVAHGSFGGVVAICQWGHSIYAVAAIWVHGGAHGLDVTCRIGDDYGHDLSRFRIGGTGDGWGVVVGQVWCHNGDGYAVVYAAIVGCFTGVARRIGYAHFYGVWTLW